jgi:hypothetical protein
VALLAAARLTFAFTMLQEELGGGWSNKRMVKFEKAQEQRPQGG